MNFMTNYTWGERGLGAEIVGGPAENKWKTKWKTKWKILNDTEG